MRQRIVSILALILLVAVYPGAVLQTGNSTAAESQSSSGERILTDAALFSQEARAGFDLTALRSPTSKTHYPIAEGQGPTIGSIRARYGQPTATLSERIPVTIHTTYSDGYGLTTEVPSRVWEREMLVLYYGDIGFAVEANADKSPVLFVTNRMTTQSDEPMHPRQFEPTDSNLRLTQTTAWGQKPSGTPEELRSVNFVSETEGWAAGANATLLHTTNGGDTWSAVSNSADPTKGFSAVRFLDQNVGFVASPSLAGRTLNAGESWTVASLPTTVLNGEVVNVSHNGFCPVSQNSFWTCGDGLLPPSTTSVGVIALYDMNSTGTISWEVNIVTIASSSLKYLGIHFLDSSGGWVVGASGLIDRVDLSDPLLIQFEASGTSKQLNAVHMLDYSSGWVVGNGGTILKYKGDGRWASQSSGTTANLRDVYFLDSNRGWAVGDGGTIVATTDGGSTWTPDYTGVSTDLRGVHGFSENVVIAVGANGTILKRGEGVSGPDFALGFDSPTVDGVCGTKVKVVVTITRMGGFTGDVTVTPPDLSAEGIMPKFPESITTSDSTAAWKFKIKAWTAEGPHQLTFTGRDADGRVRSGTVALMVQ